MKKVIIINPVNYEFSHLRPPFGLLNVGTKFIDNGVEVIWVDADVIRDNNKVINEVKQHADADLIAMGGMHTAYRSIKELCQSFRKENIDIPIIVGGWIAKSIDYMLWRKIPEISMICKQEGEYVIDAMCDGITSMQDVPGIEYRKNGDIVSNPPAREIQTPEEFLPIKWDLLGKEYYQYPMHTGRMLTSRGCPFNCHFCRFDGQRDIYRYKTIEENMRSVKYMVNNHDIKRLVFMDELFLLNKKRVEEFCYHIKEFNITWQCSSRGDSLRDSDYPLLEKMKEAGCDRIVMGIESGSKKILDKMNKRLDLKRAERTIELVRKVGILLETTFIFGYPGETRETALESVKWRKKTNLKHRFFYCQPYPGSELWNVWTKKFNLGPDEQEKYLLSPPGLKKIEINFTDMPLWKLQLLAHECVIRLNSFSWNIMYYIVFPLKIIHPKIPVLVTRFAVRVKRLFKHNPYATPEKSRDPLATMQSRYPDQI
jgi:radical SAM superfamily enzyme YgiQ (UPF0313 family)